MGELVPLSPKTHNILSRKPLLRKDGNISFPKASNLIVRQSPSVGLMSYQISGFGENLKTMEEVQDGPNVDVDQFSNEKAGGSVVENLEQRVHELDNKLKQLKVERDNVLQENEELQEQLDMSNSAQSAGNVRINELRNEMIKITEDVTKIEYMCTSQEHELKTLSDKVIDLNNVKETVKELQEESRQFKEDFGRMRTHLNVAAKLELQTQEKMYESRLHHLENVLEEMRQREGHFLRLAEETSALKDQVDALRELSVISLKHDEKDDYGAKAGPDHRETQAKADAALAEASAAHYAALMGSCSGSSLHQMFLAQSPSGLSEDNTLAREIASSGPLVVEPNNVAIELQQAAAAAPPLTPDENANDMAELPPETQDSNLEPNARDLETESLRGSEYDNAKLMLLDVDEKDPNINQGIKVSGTLKLRSRDPLMTYPTKKMEGEDIGCFPNCLTTVWSSLFD